MEPAQQLAHPADIMVGCMAPRGYNESTYTTYLAISADWPYAKEYVAYMLWAFQNCFLSCKYCKLMCADPLGHFNNKAFQNYSGSSTDETAP